MKKRGSGILCHISSLPSPYGIGDLGPGAYAFADFLSEAKQSYWQILPLNPTNERYAFSPYSSMSSCAGNNMLISPDALLGLGLLSRSDIRDSPPFSDETVDFHSCSRFKQHLFRRAYARFKEKASIFTAYHAFCSGQSSWLEEHALFTALSGHFGRIPLCDWPQDARDRNGMELQRLRETLCDAVEQEKFLQYVFFDQWQSLKNYCNERGIQIIGDFPLFMNYDSVDIWVHPEIFKVDADVVYTGTHDVNTIMGWFEQKEHPEDRLHLFDYLGRHFETDVNWELIRLALISVAHTAIIPMQDILGAGEESRFNTPGKSEGNWRWRLPPMELTAQASTLAEMTVRFGRA